MERCIFQIHVIIAGQGKYLRIYVSLTGYFPKPCIFVEVPGEHELYSADTLCLFLQSLQKCSGVSSNSSTKSSMVIFSFCILTRKP